ncbi:hypothetical protein HDU96_002844 [Phlyctochytrium bullatum]|nr:hypothetical protein HDU96_002844 [Phlyctochytrium bullatum]
MDIAHGPSCATLCNPNPDAADSDDNKHASSLAVIRNSGDGSTVPSSRNSADNSPRLYSHPAAPTYFWNAVVAGNATALTHHLFASPSCTPNFSRLHRLGGWDGPVTVLHVASFHGHLDAARVLLTAGARVATRDTFGHTALHFAVIGGHAGVVRLLLHHGADAGAVDGLGNTPLHLARCAEVARALLEGGARVDARDWAGETPLRGAVRRGDAECAGVLVEGGADVQAEDGWGISPLDWAVKSGFASVAKFVKARGVVNRLPLVLFKDDASLESSPRHSREASSRRKMSKGANEIFEWMAKAEDVESLAEWWSSDSE